MVQLDGGSMVEHSVSLVSFGEYKDKMRIGSQLYLHVSRIRQNTLTIKHMQPRRT